MARLVVMSRLFCVALVCASLASAAVDSPELGIPWLYKGLAVWAFSWAALDSFGIGANDVANSFANSVAAQTVTFKQAALIACVAEFVGCIALGKNVTDTIRSKIVNVSLFAYDPYVLMLGMSCTSLGSSVWVLAATTLQMPVSTTHATVGAVMGVGIASFGTQGVSWSYDDTGFAQIVASWFISPVVAGVVAAVIYMTVKLLILSKPDDVSFHRGLLSLPLYTFITFGIITAFMVFKGIPKAADFSKNYGASIPTVIGVAAACSLVSVFTVLPWVRRFICNNENLPWWCIPYVMCVREGTYGYYEEGTYDSSYLRTQKLNTLRHVQQVHANESTAATLGMIAGVMPVVNQPIIQPMDGTEANNATAGPDSTVVGHDLGIDLSTEIKEGKRPRVSGIPMVFTTTDKWYDTIMRKVTPGFYIDIEALCEECEELHSHANHYYDKTERLYKTLQVSTCTFSSLSHGANDIANAIGPLSAVWAIHSTGTLNTKSPVETWILAYGGLFLDLGLVVYGHNIMMVLGNKVTYQTPSRGFCMELGAMLTVLVFSKLGIPVSTTHCISGATAGVGLCNGDLRAINWRLVSIILGGWVITCPCAGIITGLVYWGLATTPHPVAGNGFF